MANVGTAYVTIQPTMQGFSKSVSSALNGQCGSLGSSAGSSFTAKFQSSGTGKIGTAIGAIAGVASTVATSAFNAIGSSMGAAIARVDQLNNFPKVMQNLGYSSDDASRSIQKMSSAIDGLPTSLDTLSGMTQQLAPLCSNLDEATDISIALNNAMLAGGKSSEDVSRAMTQYTQALSKGKPDLMDWRTLQEVMPGQLNQIAQAMLGAGKNSNDLYEALKDGTFSMQDFNNAVLKLNSEGLDGFASFEQQARDATQGIATALTNVQNRIAKAGTTIIEAFGANRISGAINGFSSMFDVIAKKLAPAFTVLGNVSEKAVSIISSGFSRLKSKVDPFTNALKASLTPLAEVGEETRKSLLTTFNGFLKSVEKGQVNIKGLSASFAVMGKNFKDSLSTTALGAYFTEMSKGYSAVTVACKGFITQLKAGKINLNSVAQTFNVLWTEMSNKLKDNSFIKVFVEWRKTAIASLNMAFSGTILGNFNQQLVKTSETLKNFLLSGNLPTINFGAMFDSAISSMQNFVAQLSPISDFIKTKFGEIGQVGAGAFDGIKNALPSVASSVSGTFSTVAGAIAGAFSSIKSEDVAGFIVNAFFGIVEKITPVVQFITATLGQVVGFLVQVGKGIAEAFSGFDISSLQMLANLSGLVTPFGLLCTVLKEIGGVLSETIGSVLQALAPVIVSIVQTALNLVQQLAPTLVNLGTIVSSVLATGLNVIMTILQALTPVFQIVCDLVAQIMPTLGELAGSIFQTLATVLSTIFSTVAQIATAILPVVLSVIQMLMPFIQQIATLISQLVASLAPIIEQLIGSLVPVIQNLMMALQPLIQAVLNVITAIMPIVQSALQVIMSLLNTLIPIITNIISVVVSVVSAIMPVISTVISIVASILTTVINVIAMIISAVSPFISFILEVIGTVITVIGEVINVITGIIATIVAVVSNIMQIVSSIVSFVVNAITGLVSAVVGFITGFVSSIISKVQEMWNSVCNAFSNGVNNAVNFVRELPQKIMDFFSDAGTWLINSGKAIIDGLVEGIKGAVSGAVNAVSGVVSSIRDLFPFSPAKKGPFSGHGWVLYSGMSIMNALADGVEKKAGATVRTVKGVMQDISDIATFDAGMNLAYAGAGSLNGGVLQVQGVSDLTSSRDSRQINVNLNYSANDDARTMFTDLVTRLETLDRVKG